MIARRLTRLVLLFSLATGPARAAEETPPQPPPDTVGQSKAGVDQLDKAVAIEPPVASPQAESGDTAPSWTNKLGRSFQSFNPDISLNADFLFQASSQSDVNEDHRPFRVREVELGLSGAVDPYGQYHVILGIEEEAPDQWAVGVEEAYFTYNDLPYDLRLRVGKFRASVGKVNDTHLHALPWIDYPRVITNYFGEEGLKGTGASLVWLVPNPWDHYLELTGEVFDNDNEVLFTGEKSNDAAELIHLKSFWELSTSSTLELGLSAATAPDSEGHGGHRSWIEGVDLTFRWRPPGKDLYQAFEFRNEILTCQKDLPNSMKTEDSWGMYSAVEYQFARRWATGVRYDYSETPDDRNLKENDYSAYATFRQSEFAFWRLAYSFQHPNSGPDKDSGSHVVFLQFNVSLGAHPAHKY
jgi:hypothetical protein